MNCRRIEFLLSCQQETPLNARDSAAVAAHLQTCARCRKRQETFRALGNQIRTEENWEPKSDLVASALLQWNAEQKTVPTPLWWKRPRLAIAFAATAMVLGLVYFVANRPTDHTAPPKLVQNGNPTSPDHIEGTEKDTPKSPEIPSPEKPQPRFANNPGGRVKVRRVFTDSIENGSPSSTDFAVPPQNRKNEVLGQKSPVVDDLDYMNSDNNATLQRWTKTQPDQIALLKQQIDKIVQAGDNFITVPFPRIAGVGDQAVRDAADSYRQQKAVVDPRLTRKVTLNLKAASFTNLCKKLSELSSIAFAADKSVADDKVTVFCRNRPLRDIMRQLTRVFGFSWRRSDETGTYEYEVYQELRGRFQEEELRNRDREEALLALDKEMEKWRPFRHADLIDLVEKYEKGNVSKEMLLKFSANGFGPSQLYFGLSPRQLTELQAGRELTFRNDGEPESQPLPPGLEQVIPKLVMGIESPSGEKLPQDPAAYTNPYATLQLRQDELGEYELHGSIYSTIREPGSISGRGLGATLAKGKSPSIGALTNAKDNAKWENAPEFQKTVSLLPEPSCELKVGSYPHFGLEAGKKVTPADIMEAFHQATGMDVISDHFTRLYDPGRFTVKEKRLFDVLNALCDVLRVRWHREEDWMLFRSANFYNERLMEIPDRLLERWAASRRKNAALLPADLIEIAQLTDWQLKSHHAAAGAMAIYALKEWPLVSEQARNHLRFLGQLSPTARQAALSDKGLGYLQLPQGLRNQFIALVFDKDANNVRVDLNDLADATLRVLYRLDNTNKVGDHHIDQLLGAHNPLLFVYGAPKPDAKKGETNSFLLHKWQCVYGPFNATIWLPNLK